MSDLVGLKANIPLTNLSIMRRANIDGHIADKIFKRLPVEISSGSFPVFDGPAYTRLEDDSLDSRGRATEMKVNANYSGSYNVKDYGKKEFLSDRALRETPPGLRDVLKRSKVYGLTDFLLVKKEVRAASIIFNISTFTPTVLAAEDRFDNDSSKPFTILGDAIERLRRKCGQKKNIKLILGDFGANKLFNHPDVLARADRLNEVVVNAEVFKRLLSFNNIGIDEVLVGSESYTASAEGLTETFTDVWGNFCMLAYIDPAPATILNKTLSKSFEEDGRSMKVQTFKESPEDEGLYYKVSTSYDLNIVSVDCGELLQTVYT